MADGVHKGLCLLRLDGIAVHKEIRLLSSADILSVTSQTTGILRQKIVRDNTPQGVIAGWHSRFSPNRIGAPGSAVPMQFLRETGSLDDQLEAEILRGLLAVQNPDGGWNLLSVSGSSSTEATAHVLLSLLGSAGVGVAESVAKAADWIITNQSSSGGWASTTFHANTPRVGLTSTALRALAGLQLSDRDVIKRGVDWLSKCQNSDGSWGPEPGMKGTVVHTAFALTALSAVGQLRSSAVKDGLNYLNRTWKAGGPIEQESYDFHVVNAYHRVTTVYDVDAEVVLALIQCRSLAADTTLWQVVCKWITDTSSGAPWWEKPPVGATLWTLVPRGLAAFTASQHLGTDGYVRWSRGAVLITTTSSARPIWRIAVSSARISRAWFRILVQISCLMLILAAVVLLVTKHIGIGEMVVGVLLPLALFLLQQAPSA